MSKRKFIIPEKVADDNSFESDIHLTRIEPEVVRGLFFTFVAEKLHLFGMWLVQKTLPYVPTYSVSMDDEETLL